MNNLSIIIVCFNKFNFTKCCLNDLLKLPKDNHEIIVVDNASTDNTYDELSKYDNIVYIRNELNFFHSKACNIGYKTSTCNNIMFINNDIKVKSNYNNWTDIIIQKCNDGLIGPTMGQLNNSFEFIKEMNNNIIGSNTYLSGWCVASSRNNWNKLDIGNGKIFDEDNLPHYFNDVDLSWRAKKLNIPINVVSLPVVHFGKISANPFMINKLYKEGKAAFHKKMSRTNTTVS